MIVALALLGCTGQPQEPTAPPPEAPVRQNVLLITLDTLRADSLGVYGQKAPTSPSIDRLARESMRFSRAYTVTPLTIPAHSSLFTGRYPPRHGVRDNGDYFLGEGAFTLAEALKAAGYATMASVGAEVTSHHWGFAQGFDTFSDDMSGGQQTPNRWRVERRGDEVIADTQAWLREQGDGPWFAWTHLYDAHHPYQPPEPYLSRFPKQPYLGEVAWLDHLVGQLVDTLKARPDWDRTWVFLVADHGEGRGSHGEQFHGMLLYDAQTRVPLIVRPPGGRTEGVFAGAASLVDVMPTVLGATEVSVPEGLDGRDMSDLVRTGEGQKDERSVYVESLYGYHHYGWAPQRALVDDHCKLIDSTHDEIYLRSDAREANNLVGGKAESHHQERVTALEALADGLVPDEGASEAAALSPARLAQLEALGYVTGGDAPLPSDGEELPDPVTHLATLKEIEAVRMKLQTGDVAGALASAEALVEANPSFYQVRLQQVQLLARLGRSDEALLAARRLVDDNPTSTSMAALAGVLAASGDPEGAVELYTASLASDPYVLQVWLPYCQLLFVSGQFQELLDELDRAAEFLPDSEDLVGFRGLAQLALGQVEPARENLERAIRIDPTQPFLNHALGVIRHADGDDIQAEAFLLEEIRLHPPAVPARRSLVEVLASQDRYEEQIAQLQQVIAVEPPDPASQHSYAQALYNLGRYEEAKVRVDGCLQLDPDDAGCVMLQANTLHKLGKEDEAQAAYQRALRLVGDVKAAP